MRDWSPTAPALPVYLACLTFPEAIDPEDAELLQDMVTAAVNEALRSAQELAASRMGGIAGMGGGLPGLPGM